MNPNAATTSAGRQPPRPHRRDRTGSPTDAPNRWLNRLRPWLVRYWLVGLPLLGLLYFGWLLNRRSVDDRLTRYNQTMAETPGQPSPLRADSARRPPPLRAEATPPDPSPLTDDFARGFREGYADVRANDEAYTAGRQTAARALLYGLLIVPFLLFFVTPVAHLQHQYFARQTLFAPERWGPWAYGFVLGFTSLIASFVVPLYLSKPALEAGLGSSVPLLTLAYVVGYSAVAQFRYHQHESHRLAQEKRVAELAALTAQVNPPFLFHALQRLRQSAEQEQLPRTAGSLDQLAGIMQYVLEESKKPVTDVAREIGFIRDYLRLQALRIPQRDNIRISTNVQWDGQPAPVAPLLLNPLIENAFKYGISMQAPCFVAIALRVTNDVLHFQARNTILPRHDLERGTGLGLANVRKRLELAYPNRHKLTIQQTDGVFAVDLKLKL